MASVGKGQSGEERPLPPAAAPTCRAAAAYAGWAAPGDVRAVAAPKTRRAARRRPACLAQACLIEGFKNKVPKVVIGSLDALLQAVRYGGGGGSGCSSDGTAAAVQARANRGTAHPRQPWGWKMACRTCRRAATRATPRAASPHPPPHVPCRAFGARALPAQAVLKALPPIFDSKDAKARELAKLIVVSWPAGRGASGRGAGPVPSHAVGSTGARGTTW